MGYLAQPHTSAGRSPTPKAYKYYVEYFVNRRPLQKKEIQLIDSSFSEKFNAVEDIVRTTAKVISDVTNYTSVIVLQNVGGVVIKNNNYRFRHNSRQSHYLKELGRRRIFAQRRIDVE